MFTFFVFTNLCLLVCDFRASSSFVFCFLFVQSVVLFQLRIKTDMYPNFCSIGLYMRWDYVCFTKIDTKILLPSCLSWTIVVPCAGSYSPECFPSVFLHYNVFQIWITLPIYMFNFGFSFFFVSQISLHILSVPFSLHLWV